jgi:hypothetical protein
MKKIRKEISFPTYKTRLFFKKNWTPPIFKPHNFLFFCSFYTIKNVIKTPPKVLQIIFEL